MRISKSMIKSGLAVLVLLLSVMPEAGARTCFLPDSEDCGEGDTNVSDISDVGSCRYYNCKDAGYKNDNLYQECYVENTVNIKNNKVSCYAVRCKMSQTACEEKAEGTNKCCNRDVASGCYYVGTCPKECDRSVYSYDSEQTGDGWTCISCHDGKGTFYKCNYDKTCEEQGYATSCSDEQIAEEVTGAKGQNGEKCYTCKGKPLSCPDGYSTTVKTCATGYKLETNGAIEGTACGKCVEDTPSEPEEKKNCTDYGLMSQTYCETEIGDVFEFRRTDDYGARCGTCDCTYTYRYLDDEKLRNLIIEEYNPSIENGLADIWYDDELDYYLFEVCLKGTKCYDKISKNPAVYTGVADKYDQELLYPMFDRIDGNSKSCLRYDEDGKEYWYFEKLCEGTPKEKCTKKFTPNGCRSYTIGGAWRGTEWGDCYCDTTENQYDEQNTCQQKTGENCAQDDNDCYRTCKSFGYYNSREDCEHVFSGKNYECLKVEGTDCYKPSYFTLYFKKQMKLHNGADGNVDIFLTTIKDNKRPNPVHMDDSDLWKKYYVSAGKYYVWVRSGELSPKITVSWENGKSCFVETDYNRGEHDYYKGDICKNIGKTIRKTDQVDQSLSVFDFNFVAGRNYKVSVEYAY